MNAWQMGLEYLRVLVWPLVVVAILLLFKAQIEQLFQRLVTLRTPVGTAEFDCQAREVSIEAQRAQLEEAQPDQYPKNGEPMTKQPTPPVMPETETAGEQVDGADRHHSELPADVYRAWTADEFLVFRELVSTDPSASVVGAWGRVEQFMRLTLSSYGQVEQRRWTTTSMVTQLQEVGLGPHFARVAEELRRLRNSAAHGGDIEITPAGALDYLDAAERLADALVMIQAKRPQLP